MRHCNFNQEETLHSQLLVCTQFRRGVGIAGATTCREKLLALPQLTHSGRVEEAALQMWAAPFKGWSHRGLEGAWLGALAVTPVVDEQASCGRNTLRQHLINTWTNIQLMRSCNGTVSCVIAFQERCIHSVHNMSKFMHSCHITRGRCKTS